MATDTTSAADRAAAAGPGMPQLDFSNWGNQIFWLVITLIVILLRSVPHCASAYCVGSGRTSGHDIK